jgi:hypothetical protein
MCKRKQGVLRYGNETTGKKNAGNEPGSETIGSETTDRSV